MNFLKSNLLVLAATIISTFCATNNASAASEVYYYANGHRIEWADENYVRGVKLQASRNNGSFTPIPIDRLANAEILHYNLTDEQYSIAYQAALEFSRVAAHLPRREQLKFIAVGLRDYYNKYVTYSTSAPHWIDAYGFFQLKTASCQGAACATGMILNQLGIEYEHVNHNKWTHQWCRVKIDNEYWICDPYGAYFGKEPAPYVHPIIN